VAQPPGTDPTVDGTSLVYASGLPHLERQTEVEAASYFGKGPGGGVNPWRPGQCEPVGLEQVPHRRARAALC